MIAEAGGLPVGQARLDYTDGQAVLSYSLDVVVRGRGWGTWLVSAAVQRAFTRGATVVTARVRDNNVASCTTFRRLGFSETPVDKAVLEFRCAERPVMQASTEGMAS
jgi:RimJ/RimL family protein N-acetyltransferase